MEIESLVSPHLFVMLKKFQDLFIAFMMKFKLSSPGNQESPPMSDSCFLFQAHLTPITSTLMFYAPMCMRAHTHTHTHTHNLTIPERVSLSEVAFLCVSKPLSMLFNYPTFAWVIASHPSGLILSLKPSFNHSSHPSWLKYFPFVLPISYQSKSCWGYLLNIARTCQFASFSLPLPFSDQGLPFAKYWKSHCLLFSHLSPIIKISFLSPA